MAFQVGELFARLSLESSQFDRGMDKGQGMLSKMGGLFAKVGVAAAAGFTAAGGMAIKGASDLEGYRNTLNVVMKDTKLAAETMVWANKYANETPWNTAGVVDATVKLTSYGLKAQEVLPQISDMASVMNKDLNQAVEAVADAQTGEVERLKEFGITKQMIIDQGNKIMKGKEIVNKQGQIVDQENFNKALFSLMDEKFKGGTALAATSFSGLMSTLKGTMSTTLTTMAGIATDGSIVIGGLFDTVKGYLAGFVTQLGIWTSDGTLDAFVAKVGNAFKVAFDAIAYVVPIVIGVMRDLWNFLGTELVPRFGQVIDIVTKIASNIFPRMGEASSGLQTTLAGMVTKAFDLVIAALTWIKDNTGLVIGVIKLLGTAWVGYQVVMGTVKLATELVTIATNIQKGAMLAYNIVMGIARAVTLGHAAALASGSVATGIATTATALFNAIMLANPIVLVIAGIVALVAILITVTGKWGAVTDAIKRAWGWLTSWNNKKVRDKSSTVTTHYRNVSTATTMDERLGNNAAGTDNWRGGLTWVGEEGPELVNLPKGAQVIPNDKAVGGSGGSTVNLKVQVAQLHVREEADINRVSQRLYDLQNRKLRGQGVRV